MSPYLRRLDPCCQSWIDPLQDRPFSQQPTQVPRTTTTVDPLSRVTAPLFSSRQPAQPSGPSSGGLSGLFGAARAARTALSGTTLPPAATPQPTACTTVLVRPSSQGTTPVVQRPETINLLGEEIKFSGAPTLPITITCLFKKEDCALLWADEQRAVVEDAIKKVLPKFKLQAISMGGTKER
jgi:hypothetical protein